MYAIMTNAAGGQTFFQGTDLPDGAEEVSAEEYRSALAKARASTAEDVATRVPDVSSAQAKIQLSRAGFLTPVEASVEAIGGEVQLWFNNARTWQRNNPHVVEVGAGLNLSPKEIDDLFRAAALINA